MKDLELAQQVRNYDDQVALQELIEKHQGIFYTIVHKYSTVFKQSGVYKNDVLDDRDYIIYKTAKSFQPDKNAKFSTWLGNCTTYECLNRISEKAKFIYSEELDNQKTCPTIQSPDPCNEEKIQFCFDEVKKLNDKRALKIFKLRYLNGTRKVMPWNQIGEKLKISTQTALNIHNKAIKRIKSKFFV
jgi:RNA polymerase sigma factor (sigma-70 family)